MYHVKSLLREVLAFILSLTESENYRFLMQFPTLRILSYIFPFAVDFKSRE